MVDFIVGHWFLFLMMFLAASLGFVWLFFINKQLKMKWWEAIIISFSSIIFGSIGAILAHYFENGFVWSDVGTSAYGAIFIALFLALLMHLLFKKYTYLVVLDNYAIIVALFMVLTRINCLYSGCCYGALIGDTSYRYPTREADILLNVIFLIFAIGNILSNKYTNKHFFFLLLTYGIGRFIIEWFRAYDGTTLFHNGHIWSLIAIAIGSVYLLITYVLSKKQIANT